MPVKVLMIESERGWGQRIEEKKEFPTLAEAEAFCREYNSKNNPPLETTPDWYMYAQISGRVGQPMLRLEEKETVNGEILYELWALLHLRLNNCTADPWDQLDQTEKDVWNELAKTTDFEPTEEHRRSLGLE